jgi:hypothetical protein
MWFPLLMKETLAQKIKVWYYFFSTSIKDSQMTTERELELALESVIECIMDHGQYPANGKVQFDLYDFLFDNRDPSYALELLVASMSSNTQSFEERIARERKTVEALLVQELTDSILVANRAAEDAE